ncbi:hypothetical protein BEH94_09420 [Candidatus Altiarchaeales archaeon WOR_SM1_SCG]|nr:hypothetical protein BEH94_09420 [Candidatus Altiarchaeales archaeon WOR_SM1_SCG]
MKIEKRFLNCENGKEKEWLIANGLGGYASSTVINLNARKYHGLLVAAIQERFLLLSKLAEEVMIGNKSYELSANKYPGAIHPQGFEFLKNFNFNYFPEFVYNVRGIVVKKNIFTIHGFNAVVVSYEIENNGNNNFEQEIIFKVKPLINARDFHGNLHSEFIDWHFRENPGKNFTGIKASYYNAPALFIGSDLMDYKSRGFWIKNMVYEKETERGQDDLDDHYCPGEFLLNIKNKTTRFNIIAAAGTGKSAGKIFGKFYAKNPGFYEKLLNSEKLRIEKIIENAYENCKIKNKDGIIDLLVRASDSFIINKPEGKSIIAGYHWFSDWGRDTMISLPGICLVTGRYDDAREILKTYAKYCKSGIIPNRFNDYGGVEYNTSDASLWFFQAVYKFLQYTNDYEFVKNNLWETLKSIIIHYSEGNGVAKMDSGGLIVSDAQTTWMDAKIGDFVVTPRAGKCVEINALWYNALKVTKILYKKFDGNRENYGKLLERNNIINIDDIKENFNKEFWNEEKECLYDFTTENYKDDSIRPNQVFAVSLPFALLDISKERKVVEKVYDELYTPFGLRSLSPDDGKYIGKYLGNQFQRDSAYHQGTAWAWLLGPFITAYVKVNDRSIGSKKQAEEFLSEIFKHLNDAGIGSISEIFDGDAPHKPRGCISQAWSVAEVLRCYCEDVL